VINDHTLQIETSCIA